MRGLRIALGCLLAIATVWLFVSIVAPTRYSGTDHSTGPMDDLKATVRGVGFQGAGQLSSGDMMELDQCGAGVMAYGAFNTFGTSLGDIIRRLQRVPGENGSESHLYVKKDNYYVVLRFLTNAPEDPKDFHFRVDWTNHLALLEDVFIGGENVGELQGGMALTNILSYPSGS